MTARPALAVGLVAILTAASGCGNCDKCLGPIPAADPAACMAAGGQCTPFAGCANPGPQVCGLSMFCCLNALDAAMDGRAADAEAE